MSINRRDFLKWSGVSAAISALPLSLQKALASGRQRGSLASVEHVVIFSQENRSFDHYLGTLNGVRGYQDPHPLRLPDGSSVFAQKSSQNKTIWPFRLNHQTTSGQCMIDVTHTWESGASAFNMGRMNQWIPAKDIYSISHYTREDIGFHYALSDAFTTCDHFFCSTNASTNPNRLFLMTGSNGQGLWPDGAMMSNDESKPFTWTTYAERLQAAGISWKMYQEDDNFDDNALAWFENFQKATPDSPLYQNGMVRHPTDAFATDVTNDQLPAVSWIIAPTSYSEHPSAPPNFGAVYSKNFLDALASNPKVWEKTVFIYTYDENGGIFDHVVPPTPPVGTVNEWKDIPGHGSIPLGLGHRIPTWLISPWSVGGSVYSETCDLTSTLRFLEKFTGVHEPNISAWRRSVCSDLINGLDFRASGYGFPATLPDPMSFVEDTINACQNLPAAQPGNETGVPATEAGGSRLLRPVNTQPSLDLFVDPATNAIYLQFENKGSLGAAFDLHGYGDRTFAPIFITVPAAGQFAQKITYTDSKTGLYDVAAHGPNGFYRRFAGQLSSSQPKVTTEIDGTMGVIALTIENPSATAIEIELSNTINKGKSVYRIEAQKNLQIWPRIKDRWYDFSVRIQGQPETIFSAEYCGHVESATEASRTYPV